MAIAPRGGDANDVDVDDPAILDDDDDDATVLDFPLFSSAMISFLIQCLGDFA